MNPTDILKQYLKENASFSLEAIETIGTFFQSRTLSKEEPLFTKGSRFPHIIFVAEGILRSFIYDDRGEEIVKTFISENEFFAELDSFEKGLPCAFNVSAITPCELLTLSRSAAQTLTEKVPGWEFAMKNEAMKAMNAMIRKQEFLNTGEATDKYRHFVNHFPGLAREIPLKHIAAYLQITQSSLSRIRKQGW